MKEIPVVNHKKCQQCGLCVSVCACGALKIVNNTVMALEVDECRGCALCELVCPHDAIHCAFEVVFENDQA